VIASRITYLKPAVTRLAVTSSLTREKVSTDRSIVPGNFINSAEVGANGMTGATSRTLKK
jgi:hypothetical protein